MTEAATLIVTGIALRYPARGQPRQSVLTYVKPHTMRKRENLIGTCTQEGNQPMVDFEDTTDICWQPAVELAERIRRREFSPVEVCEAVLSRIADVEDRVHAFISVDADGARAAAQRAEAAVLRGDTLGPLHGVPVSIKDLFPTAGLRTTSGSKFLEEHVPTFDAPAVRRLRAAGAVIVGKTNTPAFGHKDMSDNLVAEATRNPWQLNRTAGGSSGGAAAAVAAGMGPLALGSDGAGSVRIPAALCGIYGLKPSFGRIPYAPSTDYWAGRSHIGPMARTVRDAALMLTVMAGTDDADPLTIDSEAPDYLTLCDGDLRELRVAWSADFGYAPVDPEVRAATAAAARHVEALGCHVEEVNPTWDNPHEWHARLYQASIAGRQIERARQRPDWIDPSMAEMIERGLQVSMTDYVSILGQRAEFYDQALRFMKPYDLLLCPAMPCGAWAWDGTQAEIDGQPTPTMFHRLEFMYPFNLTGWPAATIPCGFTSEGLPVGLQIVANRHRDDLVLRASAALESALPWADQRPAL
jgi:Asp-tRNA(Asn)/Glu-tRNA(Gln) amidotransferase A subunit family amidase